MSFGRRTRYFVNRVQHKLLVVNIVHFLLILVVFLSAIFVPVMIEFWSSNTADIAKSQAADQFLTLHNRIWLPIVLVFILYVVHSVIVSHRIAGPLYRLGRSQKAISRGDLTIKVALRRHDYLHGEAEILNGMVEALHQKVSDIDESFLRLCAALDRLRTRASGSGMVGYELDELEAALVVMRERLEQFELDPAHGDTRRGVPSEMHQPDSLSHV